jgi:hypothetical protein
VLRRRSDINTELLQQDSLVRSIFAVHCLHSSAQLGALLDGKIFLGMVYIH